MTNKTFSKRLSANDVGSTGGHQGGILIPKSEAELLTFLPPLNADIKNPDAWIECEDEVGMLHKFRFVYYNNKLHDENGTRNEYRITYMTKYFRDIGAKEGESLEISKSSNSNTYNIRVVRAACISENQEGQEGVRIKIKPGWQRLH